MDVSIDKAGSKHLITSCSETEQSVHGGGTAVSSASTISQTRRSCLGGPLDMM